MVLSLLSVWSSALFYLFYGKYWIGGRGRTTCYPSSWINIHYVGVRTSCPDLHYPGEHQLNSLNKDNSQVSYRLIQLGTLAIVAWLSKKPHKSTYLDSKQCLKERMKKKSGRILGFFKAIFLLNSVLLKPKG